MPFLRRRGVMASENDMRRHTTLFEPTPGITTESQPKPAPTADKFLKPESATPVSATRNNEEKGEIEEESNGTISSDSVAASASGTVGMGASNEARNGAGVDEQSEEPYDGPESPPVQEETSKHYRFSMLRSRTASDSQLSTRSRLQQAEKPPPMPQPPSIITTAPTMDSIMHPKKRGMKIPMRMRRSADIPRGEHELAPKIKLSLGNKKDKRKSMVEQDHDTPASSRQTVTFQEPPRGSISAASAPQPEGEDQSSTLSAPVNRRSESSRSDGSMLESAKPSTRGIKSSGSSTSSFFRYPRRKPKQPEPLFPISHLQQKGKTPVTPAMASNSSLVPSNVTPDQPRPSTGQDGTVPGPASTQSSGLSLKTPGSSGAPLFRPASQNSGQSSPTRMHRGLRGRSSTTSSMGRSSFNDQHLPGTTRTSTSIGRKSFGDLLGLSRIRQNSDNLRQGNLTPASPGSSASKNNSFQIPRESIVLPERREDDTPAKYLARLEELFSRRVIASALSKANDQFSAAVLRSYMRSFSFFEEPMDMAIRKLLMEAELPKETQQIDRFLQAFANRYHECNPGIYSDPDQAYFIAFSLLILHTDVFNKNNKYKMQKADYLRNTGNEGIMDDILECFYDNISYTPFIHVEDDFGVNGDRFGSHKSKRKSVFPNGTPESLRRSKEPLDPYTLIIDGKLDLLRPPLKDQIPLEEHYSYLGTAKELNLKELQKTFFKTGVLQIVSARSRPDAFMTEKTANNPEEAHPGIVDIKVTKVGLLWRKDTKKKKTRSPWQEWGAILTGAQLYFFRNTTWVKNLMHQYETHLKSGHDGIPLIFNPPLEQFKPDALMSTDGAVALWDMSYKKHKSSFVYVRHGGFEEVLLAQNDDDRNDWLAKLNYAAAFRTSGVRMRGVIGGNYEGQNRRAIRRLDNTEATQLVQTPTGEVSINRGRIDQKMVRDILVARREVILQKVSEAEEKLQAAQKQLDAQLQNARHLLVLAPIQDKTREQVRGAAAKIIAQLKWSRIELWRLKCHRDILAMDLEEDKNVNGDLREDEAESSTVAEGAPDTPRLTARPPLHHSPRSQAAARVPTPLNSMDDDSPVTEDFQTPPTSAVDLASNGPSPRDIPPLGLDRHSYRKVSVSSAASSNPASVVSPSWMAANAPPTGQDRNAHNDHQADEEEDAGERHVLEQAGLLDRELPHTADRRPSSSAMASDGTPERLKRGSITGAERERLERNKVRRSLQRTLRDGAGHLSHHRSRKGKDSASSIAMSDDTVRDEVLSRGTGSFTVHGKKASVIEFGDGLQHISPDERIRQRKQSSQVDEQGTLPTHGHEENLSDSEQRGRRGSATSASTATVRSFRELHRKYSTSRARAAALGSLAVPSDEDSDAAVSFSDGRRSPLPPLGDEDEDPRPNEERRATQYFTPPRPGSPADSPLREEPEEEGEERHDDEEKEIERLPSPAVQAVGA
ncbi:hypothetical protein DL770_006997 [Monosporascus sp. CRB-9-2]|nr:hypothetical protein DL770_006997 [Monosporascus sp. CRB-9-2]